MADLEMLGIEVLFFTLIIIALLLYRRRLKH